MPKRGCCWVVVVCLLFWIVSFAAPVSAAVFENLCSGGTPIFNEEHSSQIAEYAFDGITSGSITDGWLSEAGTSSSLFPDYLGYDFGAGNEQIIKQYVIYANEALLAPKTWTFEGSLDGATWETLDTQSDVGAWVEWDPKTYEISNENAYRYYRIHITASHYHYNAVKIGELEMMASQTTTLTLTPDNTAPAVGDSLCIDVDITDADALYSAAFDLTYDPAVLEYQSASEGDFLNSDGGTTFFEAALLNGDASNGVVVVGASRVADIGEVSGSGTIATVCFTVIGGGGTDITVGLDNGYFEGSEQGVSVDITEDENPVISVEIGAPTNLSVTDPGTLDQLNLSWDATSGAVSYEVYRADTSGGAAELIGTTTATTYEDTDCILTNVAYYYSVKAVSSSGSTGDFSAEASGTAAGLSGDINKDNRVDGQDLTILARAYSTISTDSDYDCQADLDRDDAIDGDDLVVLTTGFGDQL